MEALTPRNEAQLMEWMTILSAAGFDFHVDRVAGQWSLLLDAEDADRARQEIDAVTRLNQDWPPEEAPVRAGEYTPFASWGAVLLLCLFYFWMGDYDGALPVHAAASSNADAVKAGEWWRLVTALSMHGDFGHLASNVLFLAVLGHAVCKKLGDGLGALLILGGGVLGNALNAFTHAGYHNSIGASTSSFAALGLLAGMGLVEKIRHGDWKTVWARAWIPLGGGLAMLAWTGMSPESDYRAHIFGLLMGFLLGLPCGHERLRIRNEWGQRALELATLVGFLYAWLRVFDAVRPALE